MTTKPLDLFGITDRVALVTGGSRGLGAIIAEALAHAGASVIITSTNETEIKARAEAISLATNRKVVGIKGDVSIESDCKKIIEIAENTFNQLDILINNAGINLRGGIEELTVDEFEKSLAINVTGSWLMCRSAKRLLEK